MLGWPSSKSLRCEASAKSGGSSDCLSISHLPPPPLFFLLPDLTVSPLVPSLLLTYIQINPSNPILSPQDSKFCKLALQCFSSIYQSLVKNMLVSLHFPTRIFPLRQARSLDSWEQKSDYPEHRHLEPSDQACVRLLLNQISFSPSNNLSLLLIFHPVSALFLSS